MSPRSGASGGLDLIRLLDALADVAFIVVGGVAGTLHGSPRLTLDLDIVPDPAAANVDRLAAALDQLHAAVRDPGRRDLPVTVQLLRETAQAPAGGQLRLRTDAGPLDLLWRLHDGRDYAALLPASIVTSEGSHCRRSAVRPCESDVRGQRRCGSVGSPCPWRSARSGV